MNNQVTTQQTKGIKQFFEQDNVKAKFQELMGRRSTQFITSVLQIAASNDLLKNADPVSVFNAAAVAATLDLPLNNSLGYAFIVPFNTKQKDGTYKTLAQFQLGSKGFKQLAQRSGQFLTLNDSDVREGEIEHYNRLTGEIRFNWVQDDKARQELPVIGYVSYFKLINGFEHTLYMTVEQLKQHGLKYSQTFKKGFGLWKDDFDAMARKTVIKLNLSKNAPLSVEMQTAINKDQAVINNPETEDVEYVDAPISAMEQTQAADVDKEEERVLLMIDDCTDLESLSQLKETIDYKKYKKQIDARGEFLISIIEGGADA
jgi:recombination protein RecT